MLTLLSDLEPTNNRMHQSLAVNPIAAFSSLAISKATPANVTAQCISKLVVKSNTFCYAFILLREFGCLWHRDSVAGTVTESQ
jgi:hypothetical protein